jgi:hypothetical protein
MNLKKLIIYDFKELFKILYEINKELNYDIIEINSEDTVKISLNKNDNYLFVVRRLVKNLNNQVLISSFPIKLTKLIEKLKN